jgi:hypothetical protein
MSQSIQSENFSGEPASLAPTRTINAGVTGEDAAGEGVH